MNEPMAKAVMEEELRHIYSALMKLDRNRRRQRQHARQIRHHRRKIQEATIEFFRLLTTEVQTGLRRPAGRTSTEIVRNLADWNWLKEEGRKILNAPLAEIAALSASAIRKHSIVKQTRPDPLGQAAVSWANKHAAKLVRSITTETAKALREAVRQGLEEGLSIREIAAKISPTIGLNERQVAAAGKLAAKLEEAGLSTELISKRLERYMNKAHTYRAAMIARTETAAALTEGQRIGYREMGIKRLQRIEDPEACEVCAENDGRIYDINEAEGVLPEHPNCEGTWVAAPG